MLTKREIDKRLAALVPEHGFSHTTEWSLVDREREALETAQQLAEWLEYACSMSEVFQADDKHNCQCTECVRVRAANHWLVS